MFELMPFGIHRRSDFPDPFQTILNVVDDFVSAGNYDDLLRSKDKAAYPIALCIGVDKLAIQSNGICAHKKYVRY